MNENLITWTPQNMITVFLMALIGWVILGLVIRFARMRQTGAASGYGANMAPAPNGAEG